MKSVMGLLLAITFLITSCSVVEPLPKWEDSGEPEVETPVIDEEPTIPDTARNDEIEPEAAYSTTHFSNEDELIGWFTNFVAENKEILGEALDFAPVTQCMLIQTQAARDGFLVSVTVYEDYTVPMAFTTYHTYFLLYSPSEGISIFRVDGGKGWGVSDIEDWILIYSDDETPPLVAEDAKQPSETDTSWVWVEDSYLVGADYNPIILVNNPKAIDPSWNELVRFLQQDNTDEQGYNINSFVCADFAEMLHNNAEEEGWRCAYVSVKLAGYPDWYGYDIPSNTGHTLNAFETTDRGLVFIDCTSAPGFDANADKTVDVRIGKEYIPENIFPIGGWYWGSMGIVEEIEVIQW